MKLTEKKRIVVKVGTSTLTHDTGKTNIARMAKLVSVLADLKNAGHQVVLVSSGAVGIGAGKLGMHERPDHTSGLQACAAVGQCELMFLYDKLFSEYGVVVSQLLFTGYTLNHPEEKAHLVDTFNQLLEYDALPIVNENDSVSVEELLHGDNDCLSATVAQLICAELLILLTDASPKDIRRIPPTAENPLGCAYEDAAGVTDTAAQVRTLQRQGVRVSAVFMGEDSSAGAATQIYGKNMARIRGMDQLARAAGRLIQNEIRELGD